MSSSKRRKVGVDAAPPQGMSKADFVRESARMRQDAFVQLNTVMRQSVSANASKPPNPLPLIHEYRHQSRLIHSMYGTSDIPGCDIVGMGTSENGQLTHQAMGTNTYVDEDTGETLSDKAVCLPQRIAKSLFFQNVKSVASGGVGTVFAVTLTGEVYSWGVGDLGGLGRDKDGRYSEDSPAEVTGFFTTEDDGTRICEDGSIVDVVAGAGHALFLTLRGNLYMCGFYKDQDSLTVSHDCTPESVKPSTDRPVHVALPGKVVLMARTTGHANAVVLEDKSTVYTWGFGNFGELARSDAMNVHNKLGPTDMYKNDQGIVDWKSVQEHFLTPKPAVFEGLPMKRSVVAVAMGGNFLLVAARDPNQFQAKLYTSGLNNYGQLGHGNECVNNSFHKLKLVEALAHEHIAQIAGGVHFAIALSHDGRRLYSWGRADSGQLGRGAFSSGAFDGVPKRVLFPERYVDPKTNCIVLTQITVGDTHVLAVDDQHQLYSWGFNESGQTGHDASKTENDVIFPNMLDLVSHLKQDGVTAKVDVHTICASSANSFLACRRYKKE